MELTVLSGKGGVGKTSVASSLAVMLARDHDLVAVDCDVDAPNLGLLLGLQPDDFDKEEVSVSEKAFLDRTRCTGCGRCWETCAFSAIEPGSPPGFNRLLCEGCGACQLVCPEGAIELRPVKSGWVGVAQGDFPVVGGQLRMGESGSGKIVTLIKEKAAELGPEMRVIDSPAGIGCPVIAAVRGSDYVVAVTEPTPSGLSDLQRALEVVGHFGIKAGIVINKADINLPGAEELRAYASGAGVPVLAEIPYDRAFVEAAVNLQPPVVQEPQLKKYFQSVLRAVTSGP